MRQIDFVPLARTISAIGFGCASLGSRISAKRGAEALARAYDEGVSWFDVAPSYGDGNAEILLGKFLAGKRSQVVVCTKVGVLPCRAPFALRVTRPILRNAIGLFPELRKYVVRRRPAAQRAALTGAFVESSIVKSLNRLQTDHVDVLALHEADLADVQREDVLKALDKVVRKGYARTIALAGDLNVSLAIVASSERFCIVQVANSPFVPNVVLAKRQLPVGRSVGFVTHSVYSHNGSLDALADLIAKQVHKRALMNSVGYRGEPREAAAAFLLDFALASNREGVVLLSMYKPAHFSFDIGRLNASPPPGLVLDLACRLIAQHGHPAPLDEELSGPLQYRSSP